MNNISNNNETTLLSNSNMELTIDNVTGKPIKFVHLGKELEWNKYSGEFEIYDCLLDKHFRGSKNQEEYAINIEDDNKAVCIHRRFNSTQWSIVERFTVNEDCIQWDLEITPDKGAEHRSIEIRQLVPWPKDIWSWKVWTANYRFPTMARNLGGTSIEYGGLWYGTVIPAVAVYNTTDDIGLSISKPFGMTTPKMKFCFDNYFGKGITVSNELLGLRNDPVKVSIMLRFHEGCFRPTLKWLFDKYPEYFLPGNPDVRRLEGGSTFGPPHVNKDDIVKLQKAGVKWYEIHHSFAYFGEYCPENKEWRDGSRLAINDKSSNTTAKIINDCGKNMAEEDISALLYLQIAGDSWLPIMEEKFPESLARDVDGNLFRTLINCGLINSDPSLPYGKDMQRQINGILERYPDIAGIFLDQAFYNCMDMAHDDGFTMFENKPAYMLRNCFIRHLPTLCEGLHKQGKFIYSNEPHDIELQKSFDGNMAENTTVAVSSLKYMHIAKPLLLLPYYKDDWDFEEMFRQCLLAGASWAIWTTTSQSWYINEDINEDQKLIFDSYEPLCKRLLGRRILLDPNPVRFRKPDNIFSGDLEAISDGDGKDLPNEWEIFRGENNEILISFVNRNKSVFNKDEYFKQLEFSLHIKELSSIKRAYALGVDYDGEQSIKLISVNDDLSVCVPKHGAASLIVLETN